MLPTSLIFWLFYSLFALHGTCKLKYVECVQSLELLELQMVLFCKR